MYNQKVEKKVEPRVVFTVRSIKPINEDTEQCFVLLESGIELPPKGSCYNCLDNFSSTDKYRNFRLFCDNVCENSWVEWNEKLEAEASTVTA